MYACLKKLAQNDEFADESDNLENVIVLTWIKSYEPWIMLSSIAILGQYCLSLHDISELNIWYFLSKNNTTSLHLSLRDFQMRFLKTEDFSTRTWAVSKLIFKAVSTASLSLAKESHSSLPSVIRYITKH